MDVVFRAITLFLFIWLVTRAVGRRELSTLEPFDLILLIVLGDLIQQGVTQNDFSVTGAMLAGGTFALMTVLLSWLGFRFSALQPILEGDPVIVVERGKPVEKNLRLHNDRINPVVRRRLALEFRVVDRRRIEARKGWRGETG